MSFSVSSSLSSSDTQTTGHPGHANSCTHSFRRGACIYYIGIRNANCMWRQHCVLYDAWTMAIVEHRCWYLFKLGRNGGHLNTFQLNKQIPSTWLEYYTMLTEGFALAQNRLSYFRTLSWWSGVSWHSNSIKINPIEYAGSQQFDRFGV